MGLRKGQVATEYVALVGILMLVAAPVFYLALSTSTETITTSNTLSSIRDLEEAINTVYAMGPGSRMIVTIAIPPNTIESGVANHTVYIRTRDPNTGRTNDIVITTRANVTGQIPSQQGWYRILVEALPEGTVRIGTSIVIEPQEILQEAQPGDTASTRASITNYKYEPLEGLTASIEGEIAPWTVTSQPQSPLQPGETTTIWVNTTPPQGTRSGKYTGHLVVRDSLGDEKRAKIVVTVPSLIDHSTILLQNHTLSGSDNNYTMTETIYYNITLYQPDGNPSYADAMTVTIRHPDGTIAQQYKNIEVPHGTYSSYYTIPSNSYEGWWKLEINASNQYSRHYNHTLFYVTTPEEGEPIPLTVNITSPQQGEQARGTINVNVDVYDDASINLAEYRVDNGVWQGDDTPPYSWQLDTTTLEDGIHVIEARAVNSLGEIGDDENTFIVTNNNGLITSKNPDYTTDDISFERNETLYILSWDSLIDPAETTRSDWTLRDQDNNLVTGTMFYNPDTGNYEGSYNLSNLENDTGSRAAFWELEVVIQTPEHTYDQKKIIAVGELFLEGYVLSNTSTYQEDKRVYTTDDTLYVKAWSSRVNTTQATIHEYTLSDPYGNSITLPLEYNETLQAWTGSYELARLPIDTGSVSFSWTVTITLSDGTNTYTDETEIAIDQGNNVFAPEGYIISNRSDYKNFVHEFAPNGTMYLKIWSSNINPDNMREAYYQVTSTTGTWRRFWWWWVFEPACDSGEIPLENHYDHTFTGSFNFSQWDIETCGTEYTVYMRIRDNRYTYDITDTVRLIVWPGVTPRGFVLSDNPSYRPDMRDFHDNETMYMLVWDDNLDMNNIIRRRYRFVSEKTNWWGNPVCSTNWRSLTNNGDNFTAEYDLYRLYQDGDVDYCGAFWDLQMRIRDGSGESYNIDTRVVVRPYEGYAASKTPLLDSIDTVYYGNDKIYFGIWSSRIPQNQVQDSYVHLVGWSGGTYDVPLEYNPETNRYEGYVVVSQVFQDTGSTSITWDANFVLSSSQKSYNPTITLTLIPTT